MSTPLGSMHIELGLDSSKFASNLNASKRAVQYFSAEARALDGVLKNSGNSLTALSAKHKSLSQALEKQKEVLKTLKANFDKLEPGSKKWESAAIEIEKNKAKLEGLQGQLYQVEEALKKVHAENSRWGKLGTAFQSFGDKLKNAGSKLRDMGNAMAPVSTLLSAGLTLATKKALDFEGQMQTTKALLSDTVGTTEELNQATAQLGDASKKWAKQYGLSTADINTGMQEIIKAGLDVNQTMGAMPAILSASRATGENFNTVMEASTSIMSQFGLITSDTNQMLKNTNRVTDSLSFVANKTKAGFSDMGLAMEYVGPVANSVGMDIEETAAAIGILSNAGIGGQKAGTALRGALSKLLDPSKENAKAFEKLGFSAEEFRSGAIKLPDVIERIKKNTEGMTDAQKAALIAQAFGIEAQSGINALVSEGADALRGLTQETKNAEGYTDQLYKKMSGSGKSSVERFKSSLEVLQITIGQKLLPILTPLVEKVTKWIEKISEADESTQRFWTYLGAGLAVAYPALNFLGNALSTIGTVSSTLGKGFSWVSKLGQAKAGVEALGAATTGASTATGFLSSAVSFLGGLPWWGILAGGAVLAGLSIYAAHAGEAYQRTQEWGTAVSKTEAEDLSRLKAKVDETNRAMTTFGVEGKQGVEDVRQAFQGLVDDIAKLSDQNLAKNLKLAEQLGLSPETVEAMKRSANNVVDTAQRMADDVVAIYQKHNNDRKQLTEQEKAIVLNAQNELIRSKLELEGYSSQEIIAITKAMNGELSELNQAQVNEQIQTMSKWMSEEKKSYEERKSAIKEAISTLGPEEVAARAELHQKLEALESEHTATMGAYLDNYLALRKRGFDDQMKFLSDNKLDQSAYVEATKQELEALGVSYEEFLAISSDSLGKSAQSHSLWAETVAGATEDTRKANDFWNNLTWKDGEIKTNAKEVLVETLKTAEGWEQMQFVLKHANLDTNARVMIAEALIASGEWEKLSPSEKSLVVSNNQAVSALIKSKDLMEIWNGLPDNVKKLLGDNSNFIATEKGAREVLEGWNGLTPEQKKLMAEDLTANPTKSATDALNSVKQAVPAEIKAEDKTAPAKESAQASVDSPKQTSPVSMLGRDDTGDSVASVNKSVNSPRQTSPVSMLGRNDTGPAVAQANAAVNSPRQTAPTAINAVNNASGPAQQAKWDLNSIPRTITTFIQTVKETIFKNEKGTDFHPGGLAMVNDQKGPLYKELVTLPTGESFIPQGRDVILPLPRGSKVLTASRTKAFMSKLGVPKYAEGVGYSVNSPFIQSLDRAEKRLSQQVVVQQEAGEAVGLLKAILAELKRPNMDRLAIDVSGQLSYETPDYVRVAEMAGNILAQELKRKSQLKGLAT